MSKFRQWSAQIRQNAEAQRRDWNPEPGSAHYRVYKWWLRRSGRRRAKENFCHYWRVVFIWAPLRWLAKPACYVAMAAVAALMLWLIAAYTSVFFAACATVLVIAYCLYSYMVGKQLLHDLEVNDFDVEPVQWLDNKTPTVRTLAVISVLPVVVVLGVLAFVIGVALSLLINIDKDYNGYVRSWRWLTGARVNDSKWLSWLRPWVAVVMLVLAPAIFNAEYRASIMPILIYAGIIAAFLAVIGLCSVLGDRSKARRMRRLDEADRQAKEAEINMLLQIMFEVMHPEKTGDQSEFAAWRDRYARNWRETRGRDIYDVQQWQHRERLARRWQMRVTARLDQLEREQPAASAAVRQPSRFVAASRTGCTVVIDFLSLIWSVLLARKWKVCPLIELPD